MRPNPFLLYLLGILCSAVASGAQITYASQNRSVYESGFSLLTPPDSITQSAPDFGPFDGSVHGTGIATQHSVLAPDSINDSGMVLAGRPAAAGTGYGDAGSGLQVNFTLAGPVTYTLAGTMPNIHVPPASVTVPVRYVHLQHLNGPSVIDHEGFSNDPDDFSYSGGLAPGAYQLSVAFNGHNDLVSYDYGGSYNVTLAVTSIPEPSIALLGAALPPLLVRRHQSPPRAN